MEKVIATVFSIVLFILGLAFLLAVPHTLGRILLGLALAGLSLLVLLTAIKKREAVIVEQKIELSGEVNPKILKCRNCGAELNKESVAVKAGGVFISCPYCHSSYEIEEEPKW